MQKLLAIIILLTSVCVTAEAQRQFWGTVSSGGDYQNGFIFRTDSIGDNLEIVHHFKADVDGSNISALILASNHKLYGLASSGGQGGSNNVFSSGTFFEFDLTTDEFRVIEHLGPLSTSLPNIYTPRAEGVRSLIEVSPGVIYGLARQGSYVFSYNFITGVFAKPFTVPSYNGGPSNGVLQNRIAEAFYKASDGYLYGATSTNSACPIPNPNMGSIVRITPSTNAFAIRYLASCSAVNGHVFNGHFAEANGKLYGTTNWGGTYNQGVIFEYTPSANTYVKRHDFQGGLASNSYYPTSLVVAKNGKLYGTSHGGGIADEHLSGGGGTLFEFDLQSNIFTTKYNFVSGIGWIQEMGVFPSSLINAPNGKLYGCTEFGVFEFNVTNGEARKAGRFGNRGSFPSIVQVCRKPYYQPRAVSMIEVCKAAPFTLDLESPNATTASWKHNDIIDPSQTTTVLSLTSFSEEDAGTWVCTLTNECGVTTSQTFTLVENTPDQPTITTQGALIFCEGETVVLSAPEGFDGYEWSTGETSREITVSDNGEYTVQVSNGCESPVSEPVTVTVHALPPSPTGIQMAAYNKLVATGESHLFEWTLDGELLDAQTAEITVDENGEYQVRSMSAEGCRSADFASLIFVVASVEAGDKKEIMIYPNPARGMVNVKVNSNWFSSVTMLLYDMQGRLVMSSSLDLKGEATAIPLAGLSPGLYRIILRKGSTVISANLVIR